MSTPAKMLSVALLLIAPASHAQQSEAREDQDVLRLLQPDPGGMTLAAVVHRALEVSPSVERAQLGADRAKAKAREAILGFAPRLDLSARYTRLSEVELPPFDFGDGMPIANPFPLIFNQTSLRADLSIPISEYFLTIIHGYDAVQVEEDVRAYEALVAKESLALNAIETFLGLVRARAANEVAAQSARVLKAHLEDVEKLVEAGVIPEADRSLVRAQLANAEFARRQASGAVFVSEATLRRLLHAESTESLALNEPLLDELQPQAWEEQQALDSRQEIKSIQRFVDMQEEMASYYGGGRFPRLTAGGSVNYDNPSQRIFPQTEEFRGSWAAFVSLTWSPNDFVDASSRLRDAERDVAQARTDLEQMKDAVRLEVTRAKDAYETSRELLAAAKEGLEAARLSFSDRVRLYEAGEANSRDLLDSEQELRRAQLQLVGAYLDRRIALSRLERSFGQLVTEGSGGAER